MMGQATKRAGTLIGATRGKAGRPPREELEEHLALQMAGTGRMDR